MVRSYFSKDNIIPQNDIAKNSLVIVIAIMSFLCCAALGSVYLLNSSVKHWNSELATEDSIEIFPQEGHDINADLNKASKLAINFQGIYDTEILSETTTKKLLQPWLGNDFDIHDLPIPRIIILHLYDNAAFNSSKFQEVLHQQLPNSKFNNGHLWVKELQKMAHNCSVIASFMVLLLYCALTITIIYATRSSVATNKHIIDILHFLGANHTYIRKQFDSVFLYKAIQGATLGGGSAVLLFMGLFFVNLYDEAAHMQMAAFFNDFRLDWLCYLEFIILLLTVVFSILVTCRITVTKQLRQTDFNL